MKRLTDSGHAPLMLNICIHNERPKFLDLRKIKSSVQQQKVINLIADVCAGLDILVHYWER
jgi:hypothetical protein